MDSGELEAYAVARQPLSMRFGYGTGTPMNLDRSGMDLLRLDKL